MRVYGVFAMVRTIPSWEEIVHSFCQFVLEELNRKLRSKKMFSFPVEEDE